VCVGGGDASERGGVGLKMRHLQPEELGLNMIQALETEFAVEELSSAPATNELGLEEQLTAGSFWKQLWKHSKAQLLNRQ
jgi:hypothetical protein